MLFIIFFLRFHFLPQFYSLREYFPKSENKTEEWYVFYFFPQSLFSLLEYFRHKIYLLPQFHNRIKNPQKFKTTKNKISSLGLVSFDVFPRDSVRWCGRFHNHVLNKCCALRQAHVPAVLSGEPAHPPTYDI